MSAEKAAWRWMRPIWWYVWFVICLAIGEQLVPFVQAGQFPPLSAFVGAALTGLVPWLAAQLLFRDCYAIWVREEREKTGQCLGCGYDLTGCTHTKCPECGAIPKQVDAGNNPESPQGR
ncbi:MAG: hypothetical protein EBZ48_14570 [Proteobacteria bacterium]|nr:hypothetical protein [Pseudomonadota bacterium]